MMRRLPSLLILLTAWSPSHAEVEPEALSRGLIATYGDGVVRIEPTIALNLKAGEGAHPRLGADGGTVTWQGFLNVVRADNYRFRVRLRGSFKLRIGGKEILSAEVKDDAAALKEGAEVRLEAGVLPIEAEFRRLPGAAQVELLWSMKEVREEPLPSDGLGHLPEKAPAALKASTLVEEGRYLAEEFSCTRCHKPAGGNRMAKGLVVRQGPDLSKVGSRVRDEWMYRWLDDPKKMRPGSVMPRLFSDDEAGATQRYAVTRYLVSLGGPLVDRAPKPQKPDEVKARGQQLFMSIGCLACHDPVGGEKLPVNEDEVLRKFALHAEPTRYPFKGMGVKTTVEQLTAYLRNPHALNPTSRMPNMLLDPKEAGDIAFFLCEATVGMQRKMPDAPPAAKRLEAFRTLAPAVPDQERFARLPEDGQWTELGRRVVEAKGCVNCHVIAPGGKPLNAVAAATAFNDLTGDKESKGCLADDDAKRAGAPRFAVDDNQRNALRAFVGQGLNGAGSPAPIHDATVAIRRNNCLACHIREGDGGVSPALVELLRKYEKAENAEAVTPPPLTGVGHKLRTPVLRDVLTKASRVRPWMGLRMPQFGEASVGRLPEALAALEGIDPTDEVHRVPTTGEKIAAGRLLVGKNAFGCISCHDIAGIPNHGTRGPDLVTMSDRLRYDWYQRWLDQPQRMQPGTRMPTVFPDGKSQLANVLKGDAAAQAEAMWAYLALGPTLPLPDGVEIQGAKGLPLVAKDRPVIIRTFLPEAGTRAVAVGFPDGVSTAFDAATCRLSLAWTGGFLDVAPVWNDRGGRPANLLGPRFWTAPQGCGWGLTSNNEPPDYIARRSDPAFGAKLPEGKVHDGPTALRFEGYRTFSNGGPVFRYHVGVKPEETLTVEEVVGSLRMPAGVGIRRNYRLTVPAKQSAWLLAGESPAEPRFLDDQGRPKPADNGETFADKVSLLLPRPGGRPELLRLINAPKGTRWFVQKAGPTWQAILHLPKQDAAYLMSVDLQVWVPHRDDAGLLREIILGR